MKRLLWSIILLGFISGCAKPLVVDNGNIRRVFIPCTANDLCFRDTYNIAWDNSNQDFPVSYRTKQSEYESNRVEYIWLRKPVQVEQQQFSGGAQ